MRYSSFSSASSRKDCRFKDTTVNSNCPSKYNHSFVYNIIACVSHVHKLRSTHRTTWTLTGDAKERHQAMFPVSIATLSLCEPTANGHSALIARSLSVSEMIYHYRL